MNFVAREEQVQIRSVSERGDAVTIEERLENCILEIAVMPFAVELEDRDQLPPLLHYPTQSVFHLLDPRVVIRAMLLPSKLAPVRV